MKKIILKLLIYSPIEVVNFLKISLKSLAFFIWWIIEVNAVLRKIKWKNKSLLMPFQIIRFCGRAEKLLL
jgi:hypothetical protein